MNKKGLLPSDASHAIKTLTKYWWFWVCIALAGLFMLMTLVFGAAVALLNQNIVNLNSKYEALSSDYDNVQQEIAALHEQASVPDAVASLPAEPSPPIEASVPTITEADIIDGLELYVDTLAQSGATGEYEFHSDSGIITTVITIPSATMATATPEALDEFADLVFTNMNACVRAANAGEGLSMAETDLENGYYGGLFDLYDSTIAIVDETGYIYADYMLLRTTHDVMAFYDENTASKEAEPSADADPTPTSEPEPEPPADTGSGVYITSSGSKYHSSPDCSNMKNPSEVSESTAKSRGYEPCSKCW